MFKQLRTAIILTVILTCGSQAVDISLNGVNLRVGYVMPDDPIAPTFGIGFGINPIVFTRNINADIDFFYWQESYQYDDDYGLVRSNYSDLAIKALAKFTIPMEVIRPYVGAGLGYHRWQSEYQPTYVN